MTNWFLVGLGFGVLSFFASPYVAQIPFVSDYVPWIYGGVGALAIFLGFGALGHGYH